MPESKSLIVEVTENVERLLMEMWPYQGQQSPMKTSEHHLMEVSIKDSGYTQKEIDNLGETERLRVIASRIREEDGQTSLKAATEKVREISPKVSAELSRLTEDVYPRDDPRTPKEMYDFLLRFSKAYSKKGKQRAAGAILEYLYTSCDNAFWIWREWIAACMAIGDYSSAERLIAVLIDGSASSTQAHRFNAEGGLHKPFVLISKGLIALKRDGDLPLAIKYADTGRQTYAEAPEAIQFYRAVNYVAQEVEDGSLDIRCLATGRNGVSVKKQLDDMIPPKALITGKWTETKEIANV